MKKILIPAVLLTLAAGNATASTLRDGFTTPADSVQTSAYWYWLGGNVSADGVCKDLESMKKAGINRAFIGNIDVGETNTPFDKVKLFTPQWWDIIHAALKKASELDIEIGIFNCPGWSQAGGPWIEPGQAMRYLDNVKAEIDGGRKISIQMPKPSADFQDVRVLAFPTPENSVPSLRIKATGIQGNEQYAVDRNPDTEVFFDDSGRAVFDISADTDIALRSIEIAPAYRPLRAEASLEVKEGDRYRQIAAFTVDRSNPNVEVGWAPFAPVAISVPTTFGKEFRLSITGAGKDSGIKDIIFSSVPRVERYAEKTLSKMFQSPLPYWEEYQWRMQPEADDSPGALAAEQIIDISNCLKGDSLVWNAPDGRWTIMRTGMRPTGITNGPAATEGTGLEVDKLTSAYLQHHFDSFIGEILRRIPPEDRKTFRVVVADSYEKGGQNFSDTFIADFTQRYGYDPLPYLPVYDGIVVGSRDISDRFLWDMRRFVADRLAYAHIGGMREIAHKHGLTLWLENYGHWGFPGEFLQYGGQSDEVSGEYWSEGTLGDIENRAASSCAHIYGKTKVSAESFTAAGNDFGRYPALMKQRGDRFFAEGINNTLLHVNIAQPSDTVPGMNAWFGNEFNRNNTWFSQIDLFTSYLKRCNYMLQQGLNVADAAYFIGEDAPKMTGTTDPALPRGYQFDYINGEVLLDHMTVKDGKWTLPHGTQYRILVLPKLETMRPELLERLKTLVAEGGVLLGPAPRRSPSLEGYPLADKKVAETAAELWKGIDGKTVKAGKYGKGTVLNGMDMAEALAYIGCEPDFSTDSPVHVDYGHRDTGDRQIYFISNQTPERIDFNGTFRIAGLSPELWNAIDGSVRELPEYTSDGKTTTMPIALEPFESAFIVFGKESQKKEGKNYPAAEKLTALDGQWRISFEEGHRGPSKPVKTKEIKDLTLWKDSDVQHFSGAVTYETDFKLKKLPTDEHLFVNTGIVGVMAKVYVNGRYAGGVWTAPYRVDITDFVKKGKNDIKIEVVNNWINRLIGDSALPEAERHTWTANNPGRPDSPLQPSGLLTTPILETIAY